MTPSFDFFIKGAGKEAINQLIDEHYLKLSQDKRELISFAVEHKSEDEFMGEEDSWASMIKDDYGFLPDIQIIFYPKVDKLDEAAIIAVYLIKQILNHFEGDAVLIHDFDADMLIRRNGEINLTSKDECWSESLLNALTQDTRAA
ncbi:hypothetical protein KCM76_21730 [Zooshikella marina]|uniref:Uncharacterized protein n=1 Tax=Zooshikella ganghwensis TaxID=202772 RepID=A0A4P9VG27_9GAMM|nr:SitI3 family protein [Zooshikella ganghwensis]MBU2708628.1 hypothetical protein [Zooshikella ganghwensis]RDH42088.1 hypothetical protein B9G39_00770 [Zooshikella ganghwensis]